MLEMCIRYLVVHTIDSTGYGTGTVWVPIDAQMDRDVPMSVSLDRDELIDRRLDGSGCPDGPIGAASWLAGTDLLACLLVPLGLSARHQISIRTYIPVRQ